MCDICFNIPCLSRCPNYANQVEGYCLSCGQEILKRNKYYTDCINNLFCNTDCILEYYKIKEVDGNEEL